MLGNRVGRAAALLQARPAFEPFFRRFCREVPAFFRADPRRPLLLGDIGRLTTVLAGLGYARDGAVTLADVQRRVVPAGFASGRRVRAIFDGLERIGGAQQLRQVGRERPYWLAGWIENSFAEWLSLHEMSPAGDSAGGARQPRVDKVSRGLVEAWTADPALMAPSDPDLRAIADRVCGQPILLAMAQEAWLPQSFSRKRLAADFRMSRGHVCAIVASAEAQGLIARDAGTFRIVIRPVFHASVRAWIATQAALVELVRSDVGRRGTQRQPGGQTV